MIRAEDFYTDMPPERLMGVECEYNILNQVGGKTINASRYIDEEFITAAGYPSMRCAGSGVDKGYFIPTGKVSNDLDHIEYSTAECLGADTAARADIAGVYVVSRIVAASRLPNHGLVRSAGTAVHGKPAHANTSGTHRNYLIPRSLVRSDSTVKLRTRQLVLSHLASEVWAGAGTVVDGKFRFSQKVAGITSDDENKDPWIDYAPAVSGRVAQAGGKPMVVVRDTLYEKDVFGASGHYWARLEDRRPDPLLSIHQNKLSMGAMSVVLRMAEHLPMLTDVKWDDILLKNPAAALHTFMSDLSLSETAETLSGRRIGALELQRELATIAARLMDHERLYMPASEMLVPMDWHETIDALERSDPETGNYTRLLRDKFAFAKRHAYLLEKSAGNGLESNVMQGYNLHYDLVRPYGMGMHHWKAEHEADDELQYLISEPPAGRARVRGDYITAHADDRPEEAVDWASCSIKDPLRYKDDDRYNRSFGDVYGQSY